MSRLLTGPGRVVPSAARGRTYCWNRWASPPGGVGGAIPMSYRTLVLMLVLMLTRMLTLRLTLMLRLAMVLTFLPQGMQRGSPTSLVQLV